MQGLPERRSERFRTHVGVSVATLGRNDARNGEPAKDAIVGGIRSRRLAEYVPSSLEPVATPTGYGMSGQDAGPGIRRVYDFNDQAGRNFRVYYSLGALRETAPCADTLPEIGGWVCAN